MMKGKWVEVHVPHYTTGTGVSVTPRADYGKGDNRSLSCDSDT